MNLLHLWEEEINANEKMPKLRQVLQDAVETRLREDGGISEGAGGFCSSREWGGKAAPNVDIFKYNEFVSNVCLLIFDLFDVRSDCTLCAVDIKPSYAIYFCKL